MDNVKGTSTLKREEEKKKRKVIGQSAQRPPVYVGAIYCIQAQTGKIKLPLNWAESLFKTTKVIFESIRASNIWLVGWCGLVVGMYIVHVIGMYNVRVCFGI